MENKQGWLAIMKRKRQEKYFLRSSTRLSEFQADAGVRNTMPNHFRVVRDSSLLEERLFHRSESDIRITRAFSKTCSVFPSLALRSRVVIR